MSPRATLVMHPSAPHNISSLPSPLEIPLQDLFIQWSLMLWGPPCRTKRGNHHIILVTDQYSRYVIAWASPDFTSKTIAKHFYENVICVCGTPRRLLSDNGLAFISNVFKELCTTFKIKQSFSTAYHA